LTLYSVALRASLRSNIRQYSVSGNENYTEERCKDVIESRNVNDECESVDHSHS